MPPDRSDNTHPNPYAPPGKNTNHCYCSRCGGPHGDGRRWAYRTIMRHHQNELDSRISIVPTHTGASTLSTANAGSDFTGSLQHDDVTRAQPGMFSGDSADIGADLDSQTQTATMGQAENNTAVHESELQQDSELLVGFFCYCYISLSHILTSTGGQFAAGCHSRPSRDRRS